MHPMAIYIFIICLLIAFLGWVGLCLEGLWRLYRFSRRQSEELRKGEKLIEWIVRETITIYEKKQSDDRMKFLLFMIATGLAGMASVRAYYFYLLLMQR